MQGKKPFLDKEVTRFQLSERVPLHNRYRRLSELVDWSFLYQKTQALYRHTGHPSLDPVVFFKLALVGRLENITSNRRLVEHCALRLDILLFLGYKLDEELPWHSTVSRTRQLFPDAVFERLFDHFFAQCVAWGLVAGDTQAVDSAPVKANASLDSVSEKQSANPGGSLLAPGKPVAPVPAVTAPAYHLRRLPAVPAQVHVRARGQAQAAHPHPLRRRLSPGLATPAKPL
jgi:transposase